MVLSQKWKKCQSEFSSAVETLTKVATTSSRTKKEALLQKGDCDAIALLIRAAYDPTITYGLRLNEEEVLSIKTEEKERSGDDFEDLLDRLAIRAVTGQEASQEVYETLASFPPEIRKWLIRVINRDLKIGCSTSTFNKVWPGMLPVFEVALCRKFEDDDEISTPHFIEPKLDGIRAIVGVESGKPFIFSRSGKDVYNVEEILKEVRELSFPGNYVFDGELKAKDWNETIHIVHTRDKVDSTNLKFHIFDVLPTQLWVARRSNRSLKERKSLLRQLYSGTVYPHLNEVPYKTISTTEEVWDVSSDYIKQGYEGSVVKDPSSFYIYKRSKAWRKVKFFHSEEFVIVGAEYGRAGTANENRLGALVLDVHGVNSRVGGGFKSKQRDEFWVMHEKGKLLGKKIEVKFQEITEDGALRFPSFIRIREDLS